MMRKRMSLWYSGAMMMLAVAALVTLMTVPRGAWADNDHDDHGKQEAAGPVTLTGEVVDMMCYLDHGARGAKHQSCAESCIASGGPVGILVEKGSAHSEHAEDAELYLVIGKHAPINDQLAKDAAHEITVRGKVVERHGVHMIENVEILHVGDVVKDKKG